MHAWTATIQEGIATYLFQHPAWSCTRIHPIPECLGYIHDGKFDGAIVFLEQSYLSEVRDLQIPVVEISNWLSEISFPRVVADDEAIGRLAASYLMELGLTHFGVVGRINDPRYSTIRMKSFVRAVEKEGFTVDISPTGQFGQAGQVTTPGDIVTPLGAWLKKLPKPAAVFAVDDNIATDVLELCRFQKIMVPDELCVLGVDNDTLATQFARPPLSSIAISGSKIGYEAARLLDCLIDGEPPPTKPVCIPPIGVVPRQSTNMLAVADEDVRAAIRYIRENVHEQISVKDVLRVVPLNRRYLERKFLSLIGRTPLQEIGRQRIERAKMLLAETDLSMPAIAKRSGFPNRVRLANVFHDKTGMTPTQYRRTFRLHVE